MRRLVEKAWTRWRDIRSLTPSEASDWIAPVLKGKKGTDSFPPVH